WPVHRIQMRPSGGGQMFGFRKKSRGEELDRSTIVPRIKHTNFLNALRDRGIPHDQMPVTEPLVADLLITYAFDLPGMFKMASLTDLTRLSIEPAELRELAIANLKRQLPQIAIAEAPPLKRIVTGNDLEACTLLANSFWDDLAGDVPGELVIAVPSRNVVLVCGSQTEDGLRTMRTLSDTIRSGEPVHGLSEHLLSWQGGTWALYAA
ncbi:MAG: DUF1444 family protein, partial [Isosphaeraceae bacterium]